MRTRKIGTITLLTLVLAALGIIVPILWDRYKTRAALEVRLVSSSQIVGGGPAIEKLQFSYDGQPVTRVSKYDFVLVNTGRTPIRSGDVVAVPTLSVDAPILDLRIDTLSPSDLVMIPHVDSSRRSVSFEFPLMNPQDQTQFSLFTTADEPRFEASARISGVARLDYLDARTKVNATRRTVPWTVWVVGIFTLLCVILGLILLHATGEESAIKRLVSSELSIISPGLKPADYQTIFANALPANKQNDLKRVNDFLGTLSPSDAVGEQQTKELRLLLRQTLPNSLTGPTIFFFVLAAIGMIYVIAALL